MDIQAAAKPHGGAATQRKSQDKSFRPVKLFNIAQFHEDSAVPDSGRSASPDS
jgi:hypothetical protein